MADITMCAGLDCPNKDHCHRHTAVPSPRQSIFARSPIVDGACGYFLANDGYRKAEPPNDAIFTLDDTP